MNTIPKLISVLALLVFGFANTLLLASPVVENHLEFFEKNREAIQPWKPSRGLPSSIQQIGLNEDFEVIDSGSFGDGGSIYWILKDSVNRYFAFWKEPGRKWNAELNTIETQSWDKRRFWIGTTHPGYYPGGLAVPAGSETERVSKKSRPSCRRADFRTNCGLRGEEYPEGILI